MRQKRQRADIPSLKRQAVVLGGFVLIFWVLEVIDWFLGGALNQYGVVPRSTDGLYGIAWAPFLHGDFAHLAANTVPFLGLGALVMLDGVARFFGVYIVVSVIAGLGVWVIGGAGTVHIGASGVIFGFLGYLLLGAFFRRSLKAAIVSILVGALYGGLIFGVLPGQVGISWEGHLFGFLGGAAAARLFAKRQPD